VNGVIGKAMRIDENGQVMKTGARRHLLTGWGLEALRFEWRGADCLCLGSRDQRSRLQRSDKGGLNTARLRASHALRFLAFRDAFCVLHGGCCSCPAGMGSRTAEERSSSRSLSDLRIEPSGF
jgi:hypothetical protein